MVIAHANGTRLRDLTLDSFFFATLAIDKERKNRERESGRNGVKNMDAWRRWWLGVCVGAHTTLAARRHSPS